MIEFCYFKIITLGSCQAPVLKYYIFPSENATETLEKAHKKSIFSQSFIKIHFFGKKSKLIITKDGYLKSDLEK